MPEHQQTQKSTESKTTSQRQATPRIQAPVSHPMAIIQRARINPKSLTHADVLQLQQTIGNRAVGRLLSEIGLIPSRTKQTPPVQMQTIPEEEKEPLQGKMTGTIQRQEPEEDEKLQMKSVMQRQEIPEEEEPLQGKFETIQRQEIPEEEEPLQGKFENKPEIACPSCFTTSIVQRQEIPEEEEPLQGKMVETVQRQEIPEEEELLQPKRENNTGMPDNLKAGVESLSGIDMSDVRVHYNSDKPADVGALAYTQGTNIHVAPGQERHLPHEAWHVVQQTQGRVKPTMQATGMPINDDMALEREADVMGAKALQLRRPHHIMTTEDAEAGMPVQRTGATGEELNAQGEIKWVSDEKVRLNFLSPDNNPRMVAQHKRLVSFLGGRGALVAVYSGEVVQRIIDAVTFAGQTPGTLFRPRKSVARIDVALNAYHGANQLGKLAALDNLMQVIQHYIDAKFDEGDTANVRLRPAYNLMHAAAAERPQVIRLNMLATAPNGAIAATLLDTANAPLNALNNQELQEILNVGHIANLVDLGLLLTASVSNVGAGTPALRLIRVLRETLPPHLPANLVAQLNTKRDIDEKILRGRITGGVLGAHQVPDGDHRNLIGGHSQQIQADAATFVVEGVVHNPNLTDYVTFRKLVRADTAGFAAAVQGNVGGNIVATLNQRAQAGIAVGNAPPVFPANFLAHAPLALQQQRQDAQAMAVHNIQAAAPQLAMHQATANAAAANAAANPTNATALNPFINAVTDMHASANAILLAARTAAQGTVNPGIVEADIAQLVLDIRTFQQNGPVLSATKRSTLPPRGMSEDDMLYIGDQTAAVPATLIRYRPNNNPPDGAQVETKHQLLRDNVVWVAMKENVTFQRPPPPGLPTLIGGRVSSVYPTDMNAIPPDAIHPAQDRDNFSTIP